ncbi:hypothetical protein HHI36_022567 [Cryptolaemus montrouzieri]|uniref:PRA1 family protein n=1 Tax=Cryptolaemus montrouzieri TaxID=559131 RepID=A0ABD2N0X1_9CUCU
MGETAVDLSGQIESAPTLVDSKSKVAQFQKLFRVPTEVPDLKELIKQSSQKVRPWMEFVNTTNFKTPLSIPRTAKRIKKNIEYFYGNYLFVFLGLVIYCLITSPLILLAIVGSFYINRYVNRCYENKQLTVFGMEVSKNQRYLVVGLLSMPVFYIVGVHAAIFWVLGASFFFIMLHAAFYNIELVSPSPETEALFGEEV